MQPKVSLTMIVKDEESSLAICLRSVADLVDELIVVDTGSTDRTREIASGFGARVVDFAWADDFSAARNEGLRHATGRWIFWIDADEWLADADRRRLAALFGRLEDDNHGYVMQQLCTNQSSLTRASHSVDQVVPQVRLFRNHPEVRWQYRVYEQISGGVRRIGGELRQTDVVIQHPGYEDPGVHRLKIERNLRLARQDLADHPDEPYVLYVIGVFEQLLGDHAGSLIPLRRSLQCLRPGSNYAPKLFALIAQALHRTGHVHEALALCRAARERYPDDNELRAQEASLWPDAADVGGAEEFVRRHLAAPDLHYPAPVEHDLRTFARHHLAMIYRAGGRLAEAERLWNEALVDSPGFAQGWLELGELYVSVGRWPELEQVLRRVEIHLGRTEDAAVLRARGHLARREFTPARQLLERVIQLVPQSLRPRMALSHVLLFEGRDPAAAEQALHDVLRLDPGNQQALQNLAILRGQRDAAQGAHPMAAVGPNPRGERAG